MLILLQILSGVLSDITNHAVRKENQWGGLDSNRFRQYASRLTQVHCGSPECISDRAMRLGVLRLQDLSGGIHLGRPAYPGEGGSWKTRLLLLFLKEFYC